MGLELGVAGGVWIPRNLRGRRRSVRLRGEPGDLVAELVDLGFQRRHFGRAEPWAGAIFDLGEVCTEQRQFLAQRAKQYSRDLTDHHTHTTLETGVLKLEVRRRCRVPDRLHYLDHLGWVTAGEERIATSARVI